MHDHSWANYRTAPPAIKILSWFTVLATAFFVFHTVIQFIYRDEIDKGTYYIAPWTQEIYLNIWEVIPIFLVIIGSTFADKAYRKPLIGFLLVYGICKIINIGNTYEWVDVPHLQYPQSLALLGLLITWMIHVIKRKKNILDLLKFVWIFGLTYAFIVPRFVPRGHESGNFLLASIFIFPFMMTLGLLYFFKSKNKLHERTS